VTRFGKTTAAQLRWLVIAHTAGRLDPSQAARPLAWYLVDCVDSMLADVHCPDGR
jgi:hypothetical protein